MHARWLGVVWCVLGCKYSEVALFASARPVAFDWLALADVALCSSVCSQPHTCYPAIGCPLPHTDGTHVLLQMSLGKLVVLATFVATVVTVHSAMQTHQYFFPTVTYLTTNPASRMVRSCVRNIVMWRRRTACSGAF